MLIKTLSTISPGVREARSIQARKQASDGHHRAVYEEALKRFQMHENVRLNRQISTEYEFLMIQMTDKPNGTNVKTVREHCLWW
jgi:hypothetical protein